MARGANRDLVRILIDMILRLSYTVKGKHCNPIFEIVRTRVTLTLPPTSGECRRNCLQTKWIGQFANAYWACHLKRGPFSGEKDLPRSREDAKEGEKNSFLILSR